VNGKVYLHLNDFGIAKAIEFNDPKLHKTTTANHQGTT